MRRLYNNTITAKGSNLRQILERGNPGSVSPSSSLCGFRCRERALSGLSYDYREKLRNGLLQDLKLEDAVDLFSEMAQSRPFPSIVDFNKLLTAIAKMKKYGVVISLGEQMQKLGISHNLYTFNILINCFCRSSRLSLALALLGKMMKLGYEPSIVTLSTLLNGYCHGNRISDAVSLLDQMVEMGINLT
ncbi:unnamed protein product [Microthlaspi erraticum]|uniref:Pentacotripeptide-repeat region of PRORP domain-containing protein n=1 Tax=Microthlaspi erraticum TaxID=1685480 RepID=A0A6D2IN00_9BRAS|nr:unnamed protein product [Microthlaspi erraticum]